MTLVHDLALWFWRLLPANPILVRVVTAGGKRHKHLLARAAYLGALFFVLIMQGGLAGSAGSLADAAKKSTQTFLAVSVAQLALMSFIAPVFCAGAITQEKDANTFHILLTTPLSNGQIVLGSLFSRIYFVWVLLLSGLPVFCITMIYGGVTTSEVFQSFGLAACTGLLTGSIAIFISFVRIGTRRTIFAFFLGIAVYLLAVGVFGMSPWGRLAAAPAGTDWFSGGAARMSWLAPLHPFLALMVVTGQTPAPAMSDVYGFGWPRRWLLAYPQYGYMILTTLASAGMILASLIFVRRGMREGETTFFSRYMRFFSRRSDEERRRKPRRVWRNPIAWREANTRGSASGGPMVRWVVGALGVLTALVLLLAYLGGWNPVVLNSSSIASWLTALIWIELAVVLLIVTNTAASTLTREKESLTMELLLTTPLTSQYIVAGMLQGLIRYVSPLIAVPPITILVFIISDLLAGRTPTVPYEAIVQVPLLMIAYASLAAMIGLQVSLQSRKTVRAVMISVSIVLGASGAAWACGAALMGQSGTLASALLPFLIFPAMQALIDPLATLPTIGGPSPTEVVTAQGIRAAFTLIATGLYLGVTVTLYRSMVRNFDMIVRRQSS